MSGKSWEILVQDGDRQKILSEKIKEKKDRNNPDEDD